MEKISDKNTLKIYLLYYTSKMSIINEISISKQIKEKIMDNMILYISLRESNDDRKYELLSRMLSDIENIVKTSEYYNGDKKVVYYYFNTILERCEKKFK